MRNENPNKQLRSFGASVGGIFAVIGFWPAIFGSGRLRWWALAIAAYLLLTGIVLPRSLFWIHKGWMTLGHILGQINTRILLGLVFYVVVTPTGLVRKLLGKDPMGRQTRPDLETYRTIKKSRSGSHLMRQY